MTKTEIGYATRLLGWSEPNGKNRGSNMRKVVWHLPVLSIILFLLLLTNGYAEDLKSEALSKLQQATIKVLSSPKNVVRIAVLDFEGDDGTVKSAITSIISQKTSFKIMERSDLDKILAEQGLQLKDVMDEKTRIQHGKLKGVQALLFGRVITAEQGFMSYTVRTSIKLDDVEKGQIIFAGTVEGKAVSPIRNLLGFSAAAAIIVLCILVVLGYRRKKQMSAAVTKDLSARVDITREIDKAITNIASARSQLNLRNQTATAVRLNSVEGDLMHAKQVVQTSARESVLKKDVKDYNTVAEFDARIKNLFKDLAESSQKIYDIAASHGSDNIEREIAAFSGKITNVLNDYKNRVF